jgi:hypothetical protein
MLLTRKRQDGGEQVGPIDEGDDGEKTDEKQEAGKKNKIKNDKRVQRKTTVKTNVRERLPHRKALITHLVSIPVLDHPILAHRPETMGPLLKRDLHDRVVVREYRAVTIAKVHTPDLDVLVGRAGGDEFRVGGDVEGEDGELGRVGRQRGARDVRTAVKRVPAMMREPGPTRSES